MAWPYDANHFAFSSGLYVPSASLNAMQDATVDLHRDVEIIYINGFAELDGWDYDAAGVGAWICLVNDAELEIPITTLGNNSILKEVEVKFFAVTGTSIALSLEKRNCDFATDAGAVSRTVGIGSWTGAIGANAWNVEINTGLTETMTNETMYYVQIVTADVGDIIAGVRATIQPLTATP